MDSRIIILGRDSYPAKVSLDSGESLRWTFVLLPSFSGKLECGIDLCGPGAEADIAGIYLCPQDQRQEIDILMRHSSSLCTSTQLFKGIAGGTSRVSFSGLVHVARDAQKTKARQENHSILLSREAKVETRPQLEIYADDVECSHGATTGFLREDELFYMRSRGIPEQEARRLQMISFLAPVMERLPDGLREEIVSML